MTSKKLDEKDFIRHKLYAEKKSLLGKYAELVIGSSSFFKLLRYEFSATFISPVPGAMGIFLRKLFYPGLFQNIGKGVVFGKSVVIRHPDKIKLGKRVVMDDYSLIDARGAGDEGIFIGDDVFIGRGATILSKVGPIHIGSKTSIGARSEIVSQGGVHIDEMVNIAGGCSIAGGAYNVERDDSEREHSKFTKGPIRIDRKCRFGMGAMVFDGVHIKEGTIIGAMSLVTSNLPEYCVAAGIPAKVRYKRSEQVD